MFLNFLTKMKTKATQIKDVVVVKEGTGQTGKDWTLYSVLDSDDWKYTTFAHRYTKLIGQEVTLHYEEKQVPSKDGKRTFLNRNLIEPNEVKTPNKTSAKPNEAMEILRKIEAMVYDIHRWLEQQNNL